VLLGSCLSFAALSFAPLWVARRPDRVFVGSWVLEGRVTSVRVSFWSLLEGPHQPPKAAGPDLYRRANLRNTLAVLAAGAGAGCAAWLLWTSFRRCSWH
jgi:hypothetical protein